MVDHLPPAGTKVENEWSCTSRPLVCIHGVDRDSFTFLIFLLICWRKQHDARSFMIFTHHQILCRLSNEEDEVGMACG